MEIVQTYTDHGVTGTKARRPAADKMMCKSPLVESVSLRRTCSQMAHSGSKNVKSFLDKEQQVAYLVVGATCQSLVEEEGRPEGQLAAPSWRKFNRLEATQDERR